MIEINEMSLAEIFSEIDVINDLPSDDLQISGIRIDSREVKQGNLYLAVPGTRVDGHTYILDAVAKGASVVVGSEPSQGYMDLAVPYIQVKNTRETLAYLTAAWYDFPARKLIVIGVTGTDGKTTTVNLIHQILLAAGIKAGLISTVNAVIGDQTLDTGFHVTTPEAVDLQRYLAQMVEEGITHVVLEATSHGLAQKRVAACEFDMAVVTNITHEHLDYHGDYQGYLNAKAELFRLLKISKGKTAPYNKIAILNKDDISYSSLSEIVEKTGIKLVDYGINNSADYQAVKIQQGPDGLTFTVKTAEKKADFQSTLIGEYNVSNCLAALTVCIEGLSIDWQDAIKGVKNLTSIPGRMEYLNLGQNFSAIVDFAHTPNALSRVLTAARELTSQRVIAVFGSAGLRDKEKRKLMAEVSAKMANLTVLTAEDPRTESLDSILKEMAEGMDSKGGIEGETYWRVPDRGGAIRFALDLANPDDVVIVCGKGHEQSMCFEETEYPWDDRTALLSALTDYLGTEGPDMPYLPTQVL
ncbi:MAG: UDP-N-acetylmuramoyl-L-alanyl-D-glutamate--2,6-diaminopimelate ligase [Anaerolineales bacterium]|nr:UDP-N-acetylmuramoyl-L-alanyl-D-glutamate--2,6-diaminopimelate ligase [Anaerolineales bacterium]